MQLQKENVETISKKLIGGKTGLIRYKDNRCLYMENSSEVNYVFERSIKAFS